MARKTKVIARYVGPASPIAHDVPPCDFGAVPLFAPAAEVERDMAPIVCDQVNVAGHCWCGTCD